MNVAGVPQSHWLPSFLSFCHTRRYDKQVEFIRKGEPLDCLYYVVEGSVAALIEDDDHRQIVLAYINEGEFIGEIGLFTPETARSVTLRTRTQCRVAVIARKRFRYLLDTDLRDFSKEILFAIGFQLSHKLRNTTRKVGYLAFQDVTGRVARTLLDLCEQPDAMTHPEGMQIRITRQEIGRIASCSREMAGRVLRNLEEQGLISVAGKTIVVFGAR